MTADAPFIAEVRESLRKRSKAIKHRVRQLSIERIVVRKDSEELEKLEIECPLVESARLILHVWEDRWIRIRADRPSKAGWVWQFDDEGRLAGRHSARDLVRLFEESMSAGHSGKLAPSELAALWSPVLAKGPKLV